MSATGTEVYKSALALMAEDESHTDLSDYESRAVPLINVKLAELYDINCRLMMYAGLLEPDDPQMISEFPIEFITALSDTIDYDDRIVKGMLPYALAAELLLGEDSARASYFQSKYEELKGALQKGRIEEILDCYQG